MLNYTSGVVNIIAQHSCEYRIFKSYSNNTNSDINHVKVSEPWDRNNVELWSMKLFSFRSLQRHQ